jgi:hypothetical protein
MTNLQNFQKDRQNPRVEKYFSFFTKVIFIYADKMTREENNEK